MGKAGGIIGIIAGVFGIIAAVVTLFVGGIGAAFEAEGATTVVGLGWGGVLFSFLVIVFGAVAIAKPKGAGIGLVICSIAGAILGGTIVAIFMALSLIGGILCLVGSKGAPQEQAAVATDASQAPALPAGQPWGTGRMVLYSIFSLVFPLIGIIGGIYGLVKDHTRKQGAVLLSLAIVGIFIYALVFPHQGRFIDPEKQFLGSELMVRAGISEVGLSVGQFVELLKKAQMDNGKTPEVQGWTREDNVYTLHVKMKKPLELKFTHILSAPANGAFSVLSPIEQGGEEIQPMHFVMLVASMVPNSKQQPDAAQKQVESPPPSQEVAQPIAAATPPVAQAQPAEQVNTVEQSGPCKGLDLAITTEQLECLDKKFAIADGQLNDAYKQLMSTRDEATKAALKKEQIAWIKDKEKTCAQAGKEFEGGSMEAVLISDCKVQMTEKRVAYLKSYR